MAKAIIVITYQVRMTRSGMEALLYSLFQTGRLKQLAQTV